MDCWRENWREVWREFHRRGFATKVHRRGFWREFHLKILHRMDYWRKSWREVWREFRRRGCWREFPCRTDFPRKIHHPFHRRGFVFPNLLRAFHRFPDRRGYFPREHFSLQVWRAFPFHRRRGFSRFPGWREEASAEPTARAFHPVGKDRTRGRSAGRRRVGGKVADWSAKDFDRP